MSTTKTKAKPETETEAAIDPRLAEIMEAARRAADPGADETGDQADETPEPEAPKGPQPPLPDAKLVNNRWMVRRQIQAYYVRPAIVDNKPAPCSLYDRREGGCILDPCEAFIDKPVRLEAAISQSGIRFDDVSLYDDEPIEAEISRLREMGMTATADMLRERHPQAERPSYGPLVLGDVMASTNLHRFGSSPARDDLRGFLRRHANQDHGDRGNSSGVELTEEHQAFPGAFDPAIQNAVAIRRGFGLVWSTYGPKEIAADPSWQDGRRLHIGTILGGKPRTFVWTSFDGISIS